MARFQKLTRNLFLTLHGQNVHHQQRQLSKFLVHHQQFASHAYCGAAGPVSKMTSQQKKVFCVCLSVALSAVLNRARNSRCTVITDLDTSKRSTQKAFSCCDAILETGPGAPKQAWEANCWYHTRNVDSCRCWRRTFYSCKVINRFHVNFWNRTILL
jgi:hypothetical protein